LRCDVRGGWHERQEDLIETVSASVIIPTFNGGSRIKACLDALIAQARGRNAEIIVVNDGSTDDTASVVGRYSDVRLITQANAGPAAARNRGALEAHGRILLFIDDDCVPVSYWLSAMLKPFQDPETVGVKGVYRTRQKALIARFVQLEYEDRYRLMQPLEHIDFVDTYSAAFRRDRFLEAGGYDTVFPVACAEDVELSFRMSARGWKMKFVADAMVYHTHPERLWRYLQKKYKFAFWRMLAVRKNPEKFAKDSHTPQLMKLQLLFAPALFVGLAFDVTMRPSILVSICVLAAFIASTLPFTIRTMKKDVMVGLLSPALLAARSVAQLLGVRAGVVFALRQSRSAQKPSLAEPKLRA
jgi:GT2 family glycosyltransferase